MSERKTRASPEDVIDRICRNLGTSKEAVMADPAFRKEIGADENEWVKLFIELQEGSG
jgi:hypothetical protein